MSEASENEPPSGGNRPIWTSGRFNGVGAALFAKKTENGSPSVTINKHYADAEGKDQYTKSFFLEDMPNVNAVSQLAMIELARMKQQGRGR